MKEFIKKLIERLEEKKNLFAYKCVDYAEGLADAYEQSINIVNQLAEEYMNTTPTVTNGWIPCSERLPEKEADVLLSLRSLDVYTGFMANTEGCFYVEGEGYVELENVLAWQPLPAPYRLENDNV